MWRTSLPASLLAALAASGVLPARGPPAADSIQRASNLRIRAASGLPELVPVLRAKADEPSRRLSVGLRVLASSQAGGPISFIVDLRDQLDFRRAAAALAVASASRQARRKWVTQALGAIAMRSQGRLRPLLDGLKQNGEVESWTAVSVVNRLLVKARPAAVLALASHPEVASLTEEIESEAALEDGSAGPPPDAGGGEASSSWPLEAIGVGKAWLAGIDGSGVTVGLIDSGASDQHEQLRDNFRGGPRSWFDPLSGAARPTDVRIGHGTAVLSCAVGQAREAALCGVAPGAKWIAAVGLNEGRYNNVLLTQAADWMLNVGQPDVLIAAWRLPGQRCDGWLRPIVNAWRAAGMIVVFAAGNGGPAPASDVSPANYTDVFPGAEAVLSVGAVDSEKRIDPHSSRGPNGCAGSRPYPQLVAPGADVLVAIPAAVSLYRTASGTSFAAGYVAGAAALLLQRCPHAQVEQVEQALRRGAVDLGPAGPDPAYGHGLLNVPRAIGALEKQQSCR